MGLLVKIHFASIICQLFVLVGGVSYFSCWKICVAPERYPSIAVEGQYYNNHKSCHGNLGVSLYPSFYCTHIHNIYNLLHQPAKHRLEAGRTKFWAVVGIIAGHRLGEPGREEAGVPW